MTAPQGLHGAMHGAQGETFSQQLEQASNSRPLYPDMGHGAWGGGGTVHKTKHSRLSHRIPCISLESLHVLLQLAGVLHPAPPHLNIAMRLYQVSH